MWLHIILDTHDQIFGSSYKTPNEGCRRWKET
jgi:hypothetical protein